MKHSLCTNVTSYSFTSLDLDATKRTKRPQGSFDKEFHHEVVEQDDFLLYLKNLKRILLSVHVLYLN